MNYDRLLDGRSVRVTNQRSDAESNELAQAMRALFAAHGAMLRDDPADEVQILVCFADDSETGAARAFEAAQRSLDGMMKARDGAILYVQPTRSVYSMSRSIAMDVAKYNVRVNGLEADLTAEPRALKNAPTARNVAEAALYLVSEMGRLITGECLRVDAGASLLRPGGVERWG